MKPPVVSKQRTKESREHWWLKDKRFKRVRLTTLTRLALLYQAETDKSVADFILWLEKYIEE